MGESIDWHVFTLHTTDSTLLGVFDDVEWDKKTNVCLLKFKARQSKVLTYNTTVNVKLFLSWGRGLGKGVSFKHYQPVCFQVIRMPSRLCLPTWTCCHGSFQHVFYIHLLPSWFPKEKIVFLVGFKIASVGVMGGCKVIVDACQHAVFLCVARGSMSQLCAFFFLFCPWFQPLVDESGTMLHK